MGDHTRAGRSSQEASRKPRLHNIDVTGESFDHGPWRFLPHYGPDFTAAYFDSTAEADDWSAFHAKLRHIDEARDAYGIP